MALIACIPGFLGGSDGKESACNEGDPSSIFPESGRSPGEGNGYPLQYSRLENPMDKGAWWATVHGVIKSWTQLSDFTHSLMQPIPSAAYLPDPGIEPGSPALQVDSLPTQL